MLLKNTSRHITIKKNTPKVSGYLFLVTSSKQIFVAVSNTVRCYGDNEDDDNSCWWQSRPIFVRRRCFIGKRRWNQWREANCERGSRRIFQYIFFFFLYLVFDISSSVRRILMAENINGWKYGRIMKWSNERTGNYGGGTNRRCL